MLVHSLGVDVDGSYVIWIVTLSPSQPPKPQHIGMHINHQKLNFKPKQNLLCQIFITIADQTLQTLVFEL